MKKEMGGRLARTRAALDALDDEQRLVMEGHRPGVYLRLSFTGAAGKKQPCNHGASHCPDSVFLCPVLCQSPVTASAIYNMSDAQQGAQRVATRDLPKAA